jgi:hypothetical protein
MVLAKKPPLLVTIGTALLLVTGGVIAYWGLRWRLLRTQDLPVGVRAVPEEAIAVATFSTEPEQWEQLRQFGTPETQAAFDQKLATWRDRWLTQYGISFAEDIAPWIGAEATVAWISTTPAAESETETVVPQVTLGSQSRIVLLPIADPEAAQISAAALPLGESTPAPKEYRGVTLQPIPAPADSPDSDFLVALLGTRLLLIAEDETVAQRAIDAYKGGKNIADLPGYRRSFEYIAMPESFGMVYLNIPAVTQLLAQISQPALPPELIASFQESRGLTATVAIASQGIQIESTSWLGTSSDVTYTGSNVTSTLPKYLPHDTLIMASGGDFQQLWQDLSERRSWGALTSFKPDNLALALQSSTGLTLDTDLLPWMAGEFAIAVVPPPQSGGANHETASTPNPSLVTLMQVSDRALADHAFNQLDEVVENRYRFTLSREPQGNIELVRWTSPFAGVMLARGWLDSSIAFLTVGSETEAAIVPTPRRSLATAPLFQLTTGNAPSKNNGYFFVNLEALQASNNTLFFPTLPVENQGALRAIDALGITATILDEQRLRYDIFVALKRGNRPGPLPNEATTEPPSNPAASPVPPSSPQAPPTEAPVDEVTPTESVPDDEAVPPEPVPVN